MPFTDKQRRALRSKLSHRHVKTRASHGATISYLEGWHAVAEANRIFGHDSWDRQTQSPNCVWTQTQRGLVECFYSAKVRITVRAGATTTMREGIGTGFGRSTSAEAAHEIALKAAETDATKRALATFGNPFGLALYDKDMAQVTKPRPKPSSSGVGPLATASSSTAPLVLVLGSNHQEFETEATFTAAALNASRGLKSVEAVYGFWEANLPSFKALRERGRQTGEDPTSTIISALKGRVQLLGRLQGDYHSNSADSPRAPLAEQDDRPALALPKEKRVRSKDHLAYVGRQPCLVCGRRPAQAHHLRFAQPRAMSMKVSDEFTVPLCTTHHDELHRSGDERAWWARHGIVAPLNVAERLWAESSRGRAQALLNGEDAQATERSSGANNGAGTTQ